MSHEKFRGSKMHLPVIIDLKRFARQIQWQVMDIFVPSLRPPQKINPPHLFGWSNPPYFQKFYWQPLGPWKPSAPFFSREPAPWTIDLRPRPFHQSKSKPPTWRGWNLQLFHWTHLMVKLVHEWIECIMYFHVFSIFLAIHLHSISERHRKTAPLLLHGWSSATGCLPKKRFPKPNRSAIMFPKLPVTSCW